MMFRFTSVLLVVVAFFFSPFTEAFADTINFSSSADSYMQSGSPNANNGTATVLDLTDTRDGVVRFDIGAIPSGSTITSATLTLVATAVGSATTVKNYGAHRILADWAESTVTWNTPGSTSGTHFSSSPTQTIAVSTTGSYSWDVASDVASFVNGSATNYGWRIIWSSNTSGSSKQVDFGSKENSTASNRPVLSVTYTPSDTTAPSAASNLALSGATASSLLVSWTAPGDDNDTGTAASYDLRYSTSAITSGNFSSATQVTGEPTPSVAGNSESMTVSGLSPSTTYFFALKTSDEVPNASAISNTPSLATTATADTTAPSVPTGLSASVISSSQINLSWTASTDNIGVTGYKVFRAGIQIATTTALSYSDASLSPSTSYTYTVAAYDAAGNTSAQSTGVSATTSASASSSPAPAFSLTPVISPSGAPGPSSADFYGKAYPGSKIDILRKSSVVGQYESVPLTTASVSDNGEFRVSIQNFLPAEYFFAIRATDTDGRQSRILPLISQFIPSGNTLAVKDIFIPPTIDVIPGAIPPGRPLNVLGYAPPASAVEISIDDAAHYETSADASGHYAFSTSTASFSLDNHTVKARFVLPDGAKSDFSIQRVFKVSPLAFPKTDLNGDNTVTISDWSIFLFRWGSPDAIIKKSVDFNDDGNVDISDFSIFLESNR